MRGRAAFTLLELLIAIGLFSLISAPLYKFVSLMRESNIQVEEKIEDNRIDRNIIRTIFLDVSGSNSSLSLDKHDFSRLCIRSTTNTLYGLNNPMVCWVVTEDKKLLRVEGKQYKLPLNYKNSKKVYVDKVAENIEIFNVYFHEEKILFFMKFKGKAIQSFLVKGFFKEERRTIKRYR